MRITATEEYGLRCLLDVAKSSDLGKSVTIREIAEKEGFSTHNATKFLMKLRKGLLVKSVRGTNGGYVLSRSASEINMAEVMRALGDNLEPESGEHFDKLCEKFPGSQEACVHLGNCSVRPLWVTLTAYLYGALSHITLQQLLAEEQKTGLQVKTAFREYFQSVA